MMLNDGKIAIVTGGSQGIGEAICHAYAKNGATVIVVNKNHPENGRKVASSIQNEGGQAEAITCDITDEQAIRSLIKEILAKYGRIDILVNNAGTAVFKQFEEQTLDDWNLVMDINLKGAFLLSREVIPYMKRQQYGKIIFVASIAATVGFATIAPYSASKGGMLAMAKSMVTELSSYNINVNVISPGSTITQLNKPFLDNPIFIDKIAKRTATGHPMQPRDIAGAAVFLASDEANAIHGLDLVVDNAWCSC
jgi:NAD(P)-dependent dehydrogenase (short-subunit alcohol dehydrogenase family)